MATLSTPPGKIKDAGYTGIKVNSMLSALGLKEIKSHMRLVQNNQISIIHNKFERNKYISKEEMNYVWTLYWNFVLNDFRFEDKVNYKQIKKSITVTELVKE